MAAIAQANRVPQLEQQLSSCVERILQFDRCIQKVAQQLGGVCCGGVDGDQADPNSTTSVICGAIKKLQDARDRKEPIAYAIRNDQGYWAGIWNDRKLAELILARSQASHHEKVLALYTAPDRE